MYLGDVKSCILCVLNRVFRVKIACIDQVLMLQYVYISIDASIWLNKSVVSAVWKVKYIMLMSPS